MEPRRTIWTDFQTTRRLFVSSTAKLRRHRRRQEDYKCTKNLGSHWIAETLYFSKSTGAIDFTPREKHQKPRDFTEDFEIKMLRKRLIWQRRNLNRQINGEKMIFYEDFVERTNGKWLFLYYTKRVGVGPRRILLMNINFYYFYFCFFLGTLYFFDRQHMQMHILILPKRKKRVEKKKAN